jgi:hypothetical protein
MEPYKTLRETSIELGISLNTLRTYAASGKIQVIKNDGVRYVTLNTYNELASSKNIQVYNDEYIQVYIPTATGLVSKLVKSSDCKVPDWRVVKPLDGYSETL